MMRFQFPNFDSLRVSSSAMEAVCDKGACKHSDGIRLHEVQKHLFELASSPTLANSECGSAANMMFNTDKSESLVKESLFCERQKWQASATTSSRDSQHSLGLSHLNSSYGKGNDASKDTDRSLQRDATLSNLLYFAGKHKLATTSFFQVCNERCATILQGRVEEGPTDNLRRHAECSTNRCGWCPRCKLAASFLVLSEC